MQNPFTVSRTAIRTQHNSPTPINDTRAFLLTIKSTINVPLTPLTVWCKQCEEFHPSYKAHSTEQTALNKSFRLCYPTKLAADITTREYVAAQTRFTAPDGTTRDALTSLDASCIYYPSVNTGNSQKTDTRKKDGSGNPFTQPDSPATIIARRAQNLFSCLCAGCSTDRKYHVGPIPRPVAIERAERRVPFGNITDKRFKVEIPTLEIQVPELPVVHESFGEGFPFEAGRTPGTVWVSFQDEDRLVLTSGFLESSQPIVGLFATQIVVRPRTYSQFVRSGRKIQVSKVGTDAKLAQSVREIAADRSEAASKRLIEILKKHKHLQPFAILPWTLLPIVGPAPETRYCPPGKAANSWLWKYRKGRNGSLNTAKDMSENTFRFTDVEARRNAVLSGDPAFSNREFENMTLEFCDGAAGMDDPDSFLDPWDSEVQTIQSNWFSTTATVGDAVEAARKQLRKLEYKQTMMRYRRELTVARASLEQGRWQLRYKECRQGCLCHFPKCECMRPRFNGDSECTCSGIRCQCWRVVQRCKHQFATYRPFAFCPLQWVKDDNGDEYTARTEATIGIASGYSRRQVQKTLMDIDAIVRANDRAWRKKEHGKALPPDLDDYYNTLLSRAAAYYEFNENSLKRWAERVQQLPKSWTPKERAGEQFHEWQLIHSPLFGQMNNYGAINNLAAL